MQQEQWIALFESYGALREGHFLEADGSCSFRRASMLRVFEHPDLAGQIADALMPNFAHSDVVVGVGEESGMFAYALAQRLGARCVYVQRKNGTMVLRREFSIHSGEAVLIAKDAVVTGQGVRETVELIRAMGGKVSGITAAVDLSDGRAKFRFPFHSLVSISRENHPRSACRLCRQAVPFDREP